MVEMSAGVTRSNEGFNGTVWNVLGQTYTLKEESEASMGWHALLPPGSFVPPHIHPTQDEFIYMIEGTLDLELEGVKGKRRSRRSDPVADEPRARPFQQFHGAGEMPVLGRARAEASRLVRQAA